MLTSADALQPTFWRTLCPELTLAGPSQPPAPTLPGTAATMAGLRQEGYVNWPGVFPQAWVDRLAAGVGILHRRGIPAPFAFVYDEAWLTYASLAPLLAGILGHDYRMLPDVWAWYVSPADDAAGWVPHRDRSAPTLDADGSPQSLTVWLPLTDATPLNGCMYVIPAHLDPGIRTPVVPGDGVYRFDGDMMQNVRALPATAGSLLAWNQSLLHWGARSSRRGANPRCSLAAQFQRANRPALETPLLDPHALPSFEERLGLIGHLITVFSGFLTLPPEIRVLGTALDWKLWRPRWRG